MKLLIFGSTGGTGRHIVEQALEQGHTVTAFVRDPSKLSLQHPNLKTFQGDVMNRESLVPAMEGQDVVLSALGSPANKVGTMRSQGTKNIIEAMESKGIQRLICQTSLGYGDSLKVLDKTSFVFKYIIVPFVLRKTFKDHELQEQHIKKSKLDWVIVRPGNLTDTAKTGVYRHGFAATDKHIQVEVSRADVADFMLKQINDRTYVHQTPGVSY
jgi:putative NADH-flavin reductase